MSDLIERLTRFAHSDDGSGPYNADGPLVKEAIAEIERLLRCIASIEDELTRDPPRVGDALWVCEAARAVIGHQQTTKGSEK